MDGGRLTPLSWETDIPLGDRVEHPAGCPHFQALKSGREALPWGGGTPFAKHTLRGAPNPQDLGREALPWGGGLGPRSAPLGGGVIWAAKRIIPARVPEGYVVPH